jgi:hypothetical protein
MSRVIQIDRRATDKLLFTDGDMSYLYRKGFHICSGCRQALVCGDCYCGHCREPLSAEQIEALRRAAFGRPPLSPKQLLYAAATLVAAAAIALFLIL